MEGIMRFIEYGTIKKRAANRFALIYPDVYRAGNSNLGIHYVYNIVNEARDFSIERFFLDFERSIETKDMLKNFKALLFSLNYEYGIINLLKILKNNNKYISYCKIGSINAASNKNCNFHKIDYKILKEYWNQGYGFEIVSNLINYIYSN